MFLFLRNSGGFTMQENLVEFVSKEYELNLSEQSINKLKHSLRLFCSNLSSRWQKSNRTLQNFTNNNKSWLQQVFKFSDNFANYSNKSASISSSFHIKPFNEITDRHKRRRTENLRASNSTEVLLYAAKQKLTSNGSSDFAKILDYLVKNPSEIGRVRAFCENKIEMPLFSKEKCLALFLSLDLSKQQYIELRKACIESGTNQWQSYYEIQQAKLECYPRDKVTITETSASIELQALLDLTIKRLFKVFKENVDLHTHNNLILICKWGFDGASSQSMYKQQFVDENQIAPFSSQVSFL